MADNENKGGSKPAKRTGRLRRFSDRAAHWSREMRSELKKVVWPTYSQVLNNTVVVIVLSVFIGIIIGIFDWITGTGVRALIQTVK